MEGRVSFSGHIVKVCFSANTLVGLFRRTYVHITAETLRFSIEYSSEQRFRYREHRLVQLCTTEVRDWSS